MSAYSVETSKAWRTVTRKVSSCPRRSLIVSPGPTCPSTMRSSSAAAAVFFSSTWAEREPRLARGLLKLPSLKDILADCLTPAGWVLSTASSSDTVTLPSAAAVPHPQSHDHQHTPSHPLTPDLPLQPCTKREVGDSSASLWYISRISSRRCLLDEKERR
ncbi:hypothetical protein E2C01_022169 [Portunus trituberculatus]|uniref:Uncharacterized protein n=1 Tax=Portunus trituberculatus TaxID=210409 RepID=A0A5B7E6Y1_PORTR|nr:hypothetical protein [Portunus trituberculatus]